EGHETFLLSATVTGALALAWVVLAVMVLSTKRGLDPQYNPKDRWANFPWWVVKCVVLCVFIAAMAVVLHKYAGRGDNEFMLLERGELALLGERLAQNPELLEQTDKKSGKTLLELAVESGNAKAVDLLLASGARLEDAMAGQDLVGALGNLPLFGVLLRHGANPDTPDADGWVPLHYAVATGNTNALAVLFDAGANVDARDPNHQTPRLLAIAAENLPTAGLLLEHGANPNLPDSRGDTALHKAVRQHNLEMARLLLQKGADPKIFNGANMTPLHIAAFDGQNELVELLLQQPGLVDLCNEHDRTAFDYALQGLHYDTARLLLRNGADINRVRKNGYTAIHLMVVARDYKTVEFLIGEGADVNIANAEGETAADLMRSKELQSLLDLIELRDHPPEPAATNAVDVVDAP
ncbi:MAG: ankyrin repeat domain-containing protein, partial [Kiritimatiellales bacterium]|nr:ankyrin repeat domain-containing protein [Kiritimatiellales bacterium]